MSESEHGHSAHGHSSDSASQRQSQSRPRERRGWPFWVALDLALAAMAVYIVTGELGGWRPSRPQQAFSVAVGK